MVVVIIAYTPKLSSNEFVFNTYHNETGFSNFYYVSTIGLLMSMYGFSGYEGGASMAEETTNANESAPKGIIYSCLLSGITGLIFILSVLYGMQNNIESITNGISDNSMVNLFANIF